MEKKKSQVKSYRDLIVWQKGIKLAKEIYQITSQFPKHERYGLVSQLRRAAVSVPSNIAEGQARRKPNDFIRFLHISLGSLAELDTQVILANEFRYIQPNDARNIETDIFGLRRQIYGLINSILV